MEFAINRTTLEESNLFLRSLWAELRHVFGKCAWQYTPHREGRANRITFGWADIGIESDTIEVSIRYRQRGVIHSLHLELSSGSRISRQLANNLRNAVNQAITKIGEPTVFHMRVPIISSAGAVSYYIGNNFSLVPGDSGITYLIVKVRAFDLTDAQTEAQMIISKTVDFLSVCTNSAFTIGSHNSGDPKEEKEFSEVYFSEPDWIDDHPRVGNLLGLWEEQKLFIDRLVGGDVDLNHPFLCASSHFHTAQKLWPSHLPNDFVELMIVLYVSALEVASTLYSFDSKTCDKCGQRIFSIRRRVNELTRTHLNEYIQGIIDYYYDNRSKYLHVGIISSDNNYTVTSIPLLDPSSATGCRQQLPQLPINLREYVSYILREVFLSQIVNQRQDGEAR